MKQISAEELAALRETYKKGTKVELVKMDDAQAPPPGTKGTVNFVDDVGTIMVSWETGCGLGVAYKEDIVKVIGMDEKIKKQILAIRDTGLTNMFDTITVQRLAFERNYFELVNFIEEDKQKYVKFIMTGEA